jgi:hypothetical protein
MICRTMPHKYQYPTAHAYSKIIPAPENIAQTT